MHIHLSDSQLRLGNLCNEIIWESNTQHHLQHTTEYIKLIDFPVNILEQALFISLNVALPSNVEYTTHFFPIILLKKGVEVSDTYDFSTSGILHENIVFIIMNNALYYRSNSGTSISDNVIGTIFLIK